MVDREPVGGVDNAWRRVGSIDNLTTITGVLWFDEPITYEELCDRLRGDRPRSVYRPVPRACRGRTLVGAWDDLAFEQVGVEATAGRESEREERRGERRHGSAARPSEHIEGGLVKKRAGGATRGATTRERGLKDGSASRLSSSRKSMISGDSEAERAQRERPRDEASGRGRSKTPSSPPKCATPS